MVKVTVTYFNRKSIAEGIRMLMAYGGMDFEDKRIAVEDWAEMKWTTPFGSLPFVEGDGKKVAQSLAICRYLGKKFELAGADIEEDLVLDQNVYFFNDIRMRAAMAFYEQNEQLRQTKLKDLAENYYPQWLPRLEKIIKENNGHMALGKLTWADFYFAGLYDTIKLTMQMPDLDERYPVFKQHRDSVVSLAKVKEYCDVAPKILISTNIQICSKTMCIFYV